MKKKTYDLIFSIGEACSCTATLRKSKLQNFSYPFDWLYGCDFIERINLLTSNFKDFINMEDLEYIDSRISPNPFDIYQNKINGLVFNHDFQLGVPLSESYNEIQSKYERRINRLLGHIALAKKVLVVYIKTPEDENMIKDKSMLTEALQKLRETFENTEFDILTLTNDSSMKLGDIRVEKNHPNITNLTLNYKSQNKKDEEHIVNIKVLEKVFSNFKLNKLLKPKIKISNFIEVKKLKRGFGIYLFKRIFNLISLKLSIFGCKFDFCIGKIRG